jgi:sec-independent protein translocase protein TatA
MAENLIPLAFFGNLGWPEIVVILLVILLLFGGRKLPELARGLGKGLREFKDAVRGAKNEFEDAADLDAEPEGSDQASPSDEPASDEKTPAAPAGETDKTD